MLSRQPRPPPWRAGAPAAPPGRAPGWLAPARQAVSVGLASRVFFCAGRVSFFFFPRHCARTLSLSTECTQSLTPHTLLHPSSTHTQQQAPPPPPPLARPPRRTVATAAGPPSSSSSSPSPSSRPPPPARPPGPSSSDALALRLATAVHAVQAPARFSTRFSEALAALAAAGLEAYACGWRESDVERELVRAGARDPGAPRDTAASLSYVALVWLTAEAADAAASAAAGGERDLSSGPASPPPLRSVAGRWALSPSTPALRPATHAAWAGFVRLIVDAAFTRGWAWFPLDRLGAELAAARPAGGGGGEGGEEGGSPPPPPPSPAAVAEWARVVYATLDALGPAPRCFPPPSSSSAGQGGGGSGGGGGGGSAGQH